MADLPRPLVDAHFHIYTRSMPMTDGAWHHPVSNATIERALDIMDSYGIAFGVISAASIYGTYNDYVLAALERRKRLRATLWPGLNWDITQLQAYDAAGFCGIRLLWRPLDDIPNLTDEPHRRLLRRCADLGWHVHLTEKHQRMETTLRALENAGVNVVLDHMVLVDTEEGIDDPGFLSALRAIDRGRTWVKLSGGFRFLQDGLADRVAQVLTGAAGWERMFWGSDWPFAGFEDSVTYEDTLVDLARWVPDASIRAAVTAHTPVKFFFT